MISQDGELYSDEKDVPDIGSWKCSKRSEGNVREYVGLSSDVGKLPVYDDLGAGSTALCVDTSQVYIFNLSDKKWYEL